MDASNLPNTERSNLESFQSERRMHWTSLGHKCCEAEVVNSKITYDPGGKLSNASLNKQDKGINVRVAL